MGWIAYLRLRSLGFRSLGFRSLGFRVWGLGFRVYVGFRVTLNDNQRLIGDLG